MPLLWTLLFKDILKKYFKRNICQNVENLKQTDTHIQLKENALTANKKYEKFDLNLYSH